ncbi:ATP-dependent helicase Lhr and Lhr-like helicase [Amycolatopsis xylanica]|uniref:ATP-dependent helicase Lhr and Lhr-like helicase n=1 Tax=Amycolatopsis xylanica TaxID=589385 RepID=A0A1H2SGR4_9PSEU|nr:DEAD/DEAH box helicase [Amycolatopsis xylanica]SDW30836.1 ATP-dependent helicase Lhr and Lhr-like helicase [Amycolatopsis xylanica]
MRLNDIQEGAIPAVLRAGQDVVLSAATASGKTEAAFLPICSELVGEQKGAATGVRALYVSPLKALINDQYRRLDELCEQVGVPVHRWHGDVAGAAKAKVIAKPDGILLITPESLEALFVLRGPDVARVFAGLRWIVVDEMHSFIGTERGAQLQALLHRLELSVRHGVARIGLSATLGDLTSAADFLRPGKAADIEIVESAHGGGEIKLQVRGYLDTRPDDDPDDPDADPRQGPGSLAIAEHLYGVLRGHNNLVFVNQRSKVEFFADRLRVECENKRVPNEFFPHHGNLAKDVREFVEAQLKSGRPTTAVCTSTLEMGIDIGAVTSVAQIGAPPSVAALRQRLGRAGRRGKPAILRVYVAEQEVVAQTPPADQLRAQLFQIVAMIDLLGERWYEPPDTASPHLSTLIQQLMSVIAQHQGASPAQLWTALCGTGPFAHVDQAMFTALLRDMGKAELIQQERDGLLLLGRVGERIVNHFSFYAAFASGEEYRLVNGSRTLGTVPVLFPIPVGSRLIFAGRRWEVLSVDDQAKLVEVKLASGGRAPNFVGSDAEVHDEVRHRMRRWYESEDVPGYLDPMAVRLLAEGRAAYRRLDLAVEPALRWGDDTVVFPWCGDRVLNTIAVWLTASGFRASQDSVSLTISDCSPARLRQGVRRMLDDDSVTDLSLAATVPNNTIDKYDVYLQKPLRELAYGRGHLDLAGARAILTTLVDKLPEIDRDPVTNEPGATSPCQNGLRA